MTDNRWLIKLIEPTPAMTETLPESTTPVTEVADQPTELVSSAAVAKAPDPVKVKGKSKGRFASAQPVLEKLFELYPQLFGQRFLPLKLGIFHELMAAHPDVFLRDDLKLALGVHTRSTRYLQSVAAGLARHDLDGKPVEPVAPEHGVLSCIELFKRRQTRGVDAAPDKLRKQLLAAYHSSGLSRLDFLSRLTTLDEPMTALMDEVISEVDQQRARQAALVNAFEASGKSVDDFAAELDMDARLIHSAVSQRQAG